MKSQRGLRSIILTGPSSAFEAKLTPIVNPSRAFMTQRLSEA